MAFKIDLHTHTFFSGDGVSSPEDNIAAARKSGESGCFRASNEMVRAARSVASIENSLADCLIHPLSARRGACSRRSIPL